MSARSLLIALALLAFGATKLLLAQAVFVKNGNICFASQSTQPCKQLTTSGSDRDPDVSTDGKFVVFVRGTPRDSIEGPTNFVEATELWIAEVASGRTRRLVRGGATTGASGVPIGLFKSPQFSPNGSRVYVLTIASVVSDAVYVIDVATGSTQEICAGNSLVVVKRGRYVGDLVVEQHRYFAGSGSYDWTFLLSPDGKEIGPLGDDSVPGFKDRLAEVLDSVRP